MLQLKNISYISEDSKVILKDINLNLKEKFVVITGPNGGGKSTLAKIIMGINKPSSGEVLFNGENVTNSSITERAKKGISFSFQQPAHFKGLTVGDLIKIANGKNLNISEICDCLTEVGLCAREYVNREINSNLSGGELKRIEIASAMIRSSKLSVFDEPEAGIDLWSFNKLIEAFENLNKKNNGTIIIISHQEKILNIADRIIVLAEGKVKLDGKKEEILPKISSISTCSSISKRSE